MRSASAIAFVASTLAGSAAALGNNNPVPPIEIYGSKFFYSNNGTQFFIRGVAYQQEAGGNGSAPAEDTALGYTDPLANPSNCKRDIPYLVGLRTNVIRTYAIDPTADHSQCMQMLNDAGIYVISDLSSPNIAINRNDPQWDLVLYNRYTAVVDALAPYSNVLGFFAGNEVANSANTTGASAFVKAAVRDVKAYIAAKNYRTIGVGYATSDDATIRVQLADFFNCGTDPKQSIDFWGYNIYSWCGKSNLQASGFADRTQEFSNYSVPAFFAEYGCNVPSPRLFTETSALYGSVMSPVWSGGIVYMYFQEANDFGLVSVDGNTVSTLVDYSNLQSQIKTVNPTGVQKASYTPTNRPQQCPEVDSNWLAAASPLPPAPNTELCNCMTSSLSCVAKDGLSNRDVTQLFSQVCGYPGQPCAGINSNATTGEYGAFGMCNTTQMLSYAFNAYYQQQQAADACNFGGDASTVAPAATAATCSALLNQAGPSGTGIVTAAPGSGGGGGGGAKGAASHLAVHHVQVGTILSMSLFALVAFGAGAAMVFL